jgi:hypothetical protein
VLRAAGFSSPFLEQYQSSRLRKMPPTAITTCEVIKKESVKIFRSSFGMS